MERAGVVDHCVVVGRTRRLVSDSTTCFPFRLEEESLRVCSGRASTGLEIAQVHQLVRQRGGKNSRNTIVILLE